MNKYLSPERFLRALRPIKTDKLKQHQAGSMGDGRQGKLQQRKPSSLKLLIRKFSAVKVANGGLRADENDSGNTEKVKFQLISI